MITAVYMEVISISRPLTKNGRLGEGWDSMGDVCLILTSVSAILIDL